MKIIIALCAVVCIHMAVGLPGNPQKPHDEVLEQKKEELEPPKGEEVQELAMEEDDSPKSPPKNGIIEQLSAAVNNAHDASIPQAHEQTYGLRSIYCSTKLKLTIYNRKSDYIYLWWMNYSGNYVYYGAIRPYTCYLQRSYGTHPWVVADYRGYIIATVVPYNRDVKLTIESSASW